MKSLAKNSAFNALYTVLNLLFPLITSVYVARVLLPEGVGKVAYAQSIVAYFVSFASLGLPNYGLREIARAKGKQEKKNKLFTELLIVNGISTSLSLLAYILLVLMVPSIHAQLPLFIACGFLIFLNYFNIDWFYQGEEEYVYIVCRSIGIKVLSIIALLLLVKKQSDYVLYACISSMALGGNYILNVINSRKYVHLTFKDIDIRPHLKPIIIMAAGVLLASIYSRIDATMLGIMAGDRATGLYTNATKIVDMIVTTSTAITAVFIPRLSYYFVNNKDEFTKLIKKGTGVLSFITFPLAIGLFVVAPSAVVLLFGGEFAGSAHIIRVLCVMIIIKGFGNLLCYQLVMCTGNEKERIPAAFFGSLSNVVMNAMLIPMFAGVGAAVASVIAEAIVNGYQLFKMKKILNIRFDKDTLWKSILSAVIMGAVCMVVGRIELGLLASVVATLVSGVIVYVLMNAILKNRMLYEAVEIVRKKICR